MTISPGRLPGIGRTKEMYGVKVLSVQKDTNRVKINF